MKKLIIFDLDGTILNTLPTIAHYGNLALKSIGLPEIEENQYKSFLGFGRVELIHRMLRFLGKDSEENYENAARVYDDSYISDTMYLTKPYDGTENMLKELKNMGCVLCVLSNKPHDVTASVIDSFFPGIFDCVWGKKDSFPAKPDPESVFAICAETDIPPENTVFVGDTEVDINTGKNGGFYTIGVDWGFRDRYELEKCGADSIVSSQPELLSLPIFAK